MTPKRWGFSFAIREARVGQRFFDDTRANGRAVHAFAWAEFDKPFDRGIQHLACDLGAVAIHGKWVKRCNCRDAGLAGGGRLSKNTDPDPMGETIPNPVTTTRERILPKSFR